MLPVFWDLQGKSYFMRAAARGAEMSDNGVFNDRLHFIFSQKKTLLLGSNVVDNSF